MPVEHGNLVEFFKIGDSNRDLVKNHTALFVSNETSCRSIASGFCAALSILKEVQDHRNRLKPTADSSLFRYEWNGVTLEVPDRVLEAHAINFLVDRRSEVECHIVRTNGVRMSAWDTGFKRHPVLIIRFKCQREAFVYRTIVVSVQ